MTYRGPFGVIFTDYTAMRVDGNQYLIENSCEN